MLDIGWSELLVVVLVLLLVVGPKDLPKVVRTFGQWTGKARRMARDFQNSLEEMGRETELDEMRRDLNRIGRGGAVASVERHVDPDGTLRETVQADYAAGKAGSSEPHVGQLADLPHSGAPAAGEGSGAEQEPVPATEAQPEPIPGDAAADGETPAGTGASTDKVAAER